MAYRAKLLVGVTIAQPGLTRNRAGGFVHKISDFARFKRFLVLGADCNTYYATAKELTLENAKVVLELLELNLGLEMVSEIVTVSEAGRAPRQSPGIFALALIITHAKHHSSTQSASEDTDEQKLARSAKASASRRGVDKQVRQAAVAAIPRVCRTASTLYELMAYYKVLNLDGRPASERGIGNWSHSLRKAIGDWYLNKKPLDLAMQVTKYKTRNGISTRDLLRLSHPKPSDLGKRKREAEVDDMQLVLHFAAHMDEEVVGEGQVSDFLRDCQRLRTEKNLEAVVQVIQRHSQLGWEHVGESKLLKHPAIWAALLDRGMGLTALIRNLNRFLEIKLVDTAGKLAEHSWSREGFEYLETAEERREREAEERKRIEEMYREHESHFKSLGMSFEDYYRRQTLQWLSTSDDSEDASKADQEAAELPWVPEKDYLDLICNRLTDREALVKGRIHPLRVLLAMIVLLKKYTRVHLPERLVSALEQSFELSFAAARSTGKKFLIALDVSGSMDSPCLGNDKLTCREATIAFATVLNRVETNVQVVAFCDKLVPFPMPKDESLVSVLKRAQGLPFGGTDCSLPIRHAIDNNLDVDVFVVMTDNETWQGASVRSCLEKYRNIQASNGRTEPAKMMVCAFSATEVSIADPSDPGMLDVGGFDAALPEIMEDFVLGSYTTSKL